MLLDPFENSQVINYDNQGSLNSNDSISYKYSNIYKQANLIE